MIFTKIHHSLGALRYLSTEIFWIYSGAPLSPRKKNKIKKIHSPALAVGFNTSENMKEVSSLRSIPCRGMEACLDDPCELCPEESPMLDWSQGRGQTKRGPDRLKDR